MEVRVFSTAPIPLKQMEKLPSGAPASAGRYACPLPLPLASTYGRFMDTVTADSAFLQSRFAQPVPISESACLLAAQTAAQVLASGDTARPFVLGISGAQGSGKSTLAELVATLLGERYGKTIAVLSLDDFYLPRAEREELGRSVHPLCATRGVAGTHDAAMMLACLQQLDAAGPDTETAIPAFSKLADDRLPQSEWTTITGRPDLVIVEGWCVGLRAEHLSDWNGATNALEAEEDPDGIWAQWSAACLPDYAPIWDRIDLLLGIMLPDLETVVQSRLKQERTMVERGGDPSKAMDEAGVRRFVAHYERHTRAIWAAFPGMADLLVRREGNFEYTVL